MVAPKKKKCSVTLQIPYNKKTLEHIFKAEGELRKAGVSFDTGAWVQKGIREWQLDFSLKGAKTVCQ